MKTATLISLLLCLATLAVLLLKSDPPDFPDWVEPAHFSSNLILAIALAACLAAWRSARTVEVAWLTLVSGSGLVVVLEIIQLANPQRSFEISDILFGFAGISLGAIFSYVLIRLLNRKNFSALIVAVNVLVATFLIFFFIKTNPVRALSCEIQQPDSSDWTSVLLSDFSHQKGLLTNNKMGFCTTQEEIVAKNGTVYTAPLRLTLNGLAERVRQQHSFVIGIQFNSSSIQSYSEIASITWHGTANSYFARINRSGQHLMAMLRFDGGERTSTSLANGVTQGKLQELIIQYDGKRQTTWLNGELRGTEVSTINPLKTKDRELVLNITQTSDRKWWVPFEGEIKAVYLGTQVLEAADIPSIFYAEDKRTTLQ